MTLYPVFFSPGMQSSLTHLLEQSLDALRSTKTLIAAMPDLLDLSLTPVHSEQLPPAATCSGTLQRFSESLCCHADDLYRQWKMMVELGHRVSSRPVLVVTE